MYIDEKRAIEILGEEIYYDCIAFFQEILERNSEYKIILTRRCFTLFKIFYPILIQKGIGNQYGKIITDKALGLYSDEITELLLNSIDSENAVVLVVDDIIIYGRTINSILDEIVSKANEYEMRRNLIDNMLVRCIMQNKFKSQIKEEYSKMILAQSFGSKSNWKKLSSKFSALIKSANIANTSYIISYKTDLDVELRVNDFCKYCNENMVRKTSAELKSLNVESYMMNATVNNNILLSKFVASSWIRIYVYRNLNSVVVSPLVVLKELNDVEIDMLVGYLNTSVVSQKNIYSRFLLQTDDEKYYSTKIRFIILLLSHCLLRDFLKMQNYLEERIDNFDYEEILSYNFSSSIADEFKTLHNDIFKLKCHDFIFSKSIIGENADQTKVEKYLFRQAMRDNQAAISSDSKRLEGISQIGSESVFSFDIMPTILSFIDTGKAALKTSYKNNRFVSMIYPGEQAFRIMEDKFKPYLGYLYRLERYSVLYSDNSYNLYEKFVLYLLDSRGSRDDGNQITDDEARSLFDYIKILEETNQQISDVCSNDSAHTNDSLEDLFNEFVEKEVI